MKSFLLLLCMFIVGCQTDVDVVPQFRDTSIEGRTITAFRAVIGGTEYYVDDAAYTCIDLVLYDRATTSPYAPAASCTPDLYSFTSVSETSIPLFSG